MNMMSSLYRKFNLLINSFGLIVVKGFGMVTQFVLLPLYIDLFSSKEVAGVWITIVSIMSWITLFDFGIGQGLRNELTASLAKRDMLGAKKIITTAYCISAPIAVILSIIFCLTTIFLDLNAMFGIDKAQLDANSLKLGILVMICGTSLYLFLNLIVFVFYSLQKPALGNGVSMIANAFFLLAVIVIKWMSLFGTHRFIAVCVIYVLTLNLPCALSMLAVFRKKLRYCAPQIGFYDKEKARVLLSVGGQLFWLQIIWAIISRTNEFLIAIITSAENVIEYQIYSKLFGLVGAFVIASFVPMWSATTKAMIEGRYQWIKSMYIKMLIIAAVTLLAELLFVFPNLQILIDIWLKKNTFEVDSKKALMVMLGNLVFVIHSANTNISNGMSNFRLQSIVMTIAAIVDIPLSFLISKVVGNWTGVVIANIIVLLIYEVLQFIDTINKLNNTIKGLEL